MSVQFGQLSLSVCQTFSPDQLEGNSEKTKTLWKTKKKDFAELHCDWRGARGYKSDRYGELQVKTFPTNI